MVDEELLKSSREYLSQLNAQIAKAEREMVEKIERWGKDDKECYTSHAARANSRNLPISARARSS